MGGMQPAAGGCTPVWSITRSIIKVPVNSWQNLRVSFHQMTERIIKVVTLYPEEIVDVQVNANINL